MKITVGVSNHHVHISAEDFKILFGDIPMTIKNNLNQPGEFASEHLVTIKGEKGELTNFRVLGPARSYTQVEVSKTDCYKLGINPPVRSSGDIKDASLVTLIGPVGEIERHAAIIATRHIHVDENIRKLYHLEDVEMVKVKINTEKAGTMENVYLKDTKEAFFEMHIDTDDANAFLLKSNDEIEIIL